MPVTVIIPYYNNPQIVECVRSVLEQTYPAIELLICDDGSREDRSGELREYIAANQRGNIVRSEVIRSETNQGTVHNINAGLWEAHGDPIYTLAGDDVFYDSHVLEDWTAAFAEYGADVVLGYRAVCDETLETEYAKAPDEKRAALLKSGDRKRIWRELCRDNFIFGCATGRSAACVEKYGRIPDSYRLIEDYPMNLRWLRLGAKVILIDRTVVKHRKGGASFALNVSEDYIHDTRCIYEQEILPYVRFPGLWKLSLHRQIALRVREARYLKLRKKNRSLAWNLICHILYPEIILKYLRAHRKSAKKGNS